MEGAIVVAVVVDIVVVKLHPVLIALDSSTLLVTPAAQSFRDLVQTGHCTCSDRDHEFKALVLGRTDPVSVDG